MKIIQLSLIVSIFLFSKNVSAQTFEGVWKGTSICQVKNSPCHDETVVYYVSIDSTGKAYQINGYKIINGKEDFMGTIMFNYDEKQKSYFSLDTGDALWEFKIMGNTLKGTLVYKRTLYRLIEAKKDN